MSPQQLTPEYLWKDGTTIRFATVSVSLETTPYSYPNFLNLISVSLEHRCSYVSPAFSKSSVKYVCKCAGATICGPSNSSGNTAIVSTKCMNGAKLGQHKTLKCQSVLLTGILPPLSHIFRVLTRLTAAVHLVQMVNELIALAITAYIGKYWPTISFQLHNIRYTFLLVSQLSKKPTFPSHTSNVDNVDNVFFSRVAPTTRKGFSLLSSRVTYINEALCDLPAEAGDIRFAIVGNWQLQLS